MKSIPLQFKKIAVGAYICSAMTGILFALIFATFSACGVLGLLPYVAISIPVWRWIDDINEAERDYRRRERSRKAI